jgi:hypothetical protein
LIRAEIELHCRADVDPPGQVSAVAAPQRFKIGRGTEGGIVITPPGVRERQAAVQLDPARLPVQPGAAGNLAGLLEFGRIGKGIERRGETIDVEPALRVTCRRPCRKPRRQRDARRPPSRHWRNPSASVPLAAEDTPSLRVWPPLRTTP